MIRRVGMSTSLLWPAPLRDVLLRLGQAGFLLIEVSPDHLLRDAGDAAAAEEAGQRVRSLGLECIALHAPFGAENDLGRPLPDDGRLTSRHTYACQAAQTLGASILIAHPSDLERDRHAVYEVLERSRLRLEALSEQCAPQGLTLAIEYMLPHLIGGDTAELLWLCERLPADRFGLCLDIGHAFFRGDLPGTIRALAGRTVYVHASDNHQTRDEHALPGEGAVDWRAVLAALDETDYRGPITVEPAPREMGDGRMVALRHYLEDRLGEYAQRPS